MKYDTINMLLPTRQRVKNGKLPRFVKSCEACASDPRHVVITFLVDPGDDETVEYLASLKTPLRFQVLPAADGGGKPHLARMYNQLYEETRFREPGTLVSMVGDDMEWQTSGYDLAILNMTNKHSGMAVVYCDDGYIQHDKLMVNLFTTRKVVELTQRPFMCPEFPAYFMDTLWTQVAKRTGIAYYLKDVVLKHWHMSRNPKAIDETARRLRVQRPNYPAGYKIVKREADKIVKVLKRKGV